MSKTLTKIRNFSDAVPTPLSGLALGIASLGIGLETSLPLHSFGQSLGALVSFALLLLIATKFILHPALLLKDLRHPVLGSIMPTMAMALMLQTKSLNFFSHQAAEVVWLAAVLLHLTLLLAFIRFRLSSFSLDQMVPSWFVPFVGIAVAAVTVPCVEYEPLAYGLMIFAMVSYAIMLPIMSYRLVFAMEIADPFKPTIAIMAAPASLLLAAYLSLERFPSLLLCSILLGIAIFMTGLIYLAFFKLLTLPFSPAFASYTFPLAVGATALYKVSERLLAYAALEYSVQIKTMAVFEMIVATLVVFYVCLRYLLYTVRALDAFARARKAARMEKIILPAASSLMMSSDPLRRKRGLCRIPLLQAMLSQCQAAQHDGKVVL